MPQHWILMQLEYRNAKQNTRFCTFKKLLLPPDDFLCLPRHFPPAE